MEWISKSNILIVGLGLIGGSYAKALTRLGYHVTALARRQETIDYAVSNGIIAEGSAEVDPAMVPPVSVQRTDSAMTTRWSLWPQSVSVGAFIPPDTVIRFSSASTAAPNFPSSSAMTAPRSLSFIRSRRVPVKVPP